MPHTADSSLTRERVAVLTATYRARVLAACPGAEIVLSGSASVDGLDARDVDLAILVEDVAAGAATLRRTFEPLYEEQWSENWAGFRDPGPPQVDLGLVRRGTQEDARHRRVWELLAADERRLAEYRALRKSRHFDEAGKAAFFARVAAEFGA